MQTRKWIRNAIRFFGSILILTLNAILVAVAWIEPSFFWCTWLGIGLLVFLAKDSQPRFAALRAYLTFLVALMMAFWWAPDALKYSIGCSWWIGLLLSIAFLLVEAVQIGFIFWLTRWIQTVVNFNSWLILPPVWVAVEFVWPKVCPWLLGYSQIEFLPLIQIADITGAYGVSFLVVVFGVLLCQIAAIIICRIDKREIPHYLTRDTIIGVILISASLVYGVIRMNQLRSVEAETIYRVALLQVDTRFTHSTPRLQEMTADLQDGQTNLVIWPETSFGCYDRSLTDFRVKEKVMDYSRGLDRGLQPNLGSGLQLLGAGESYETGVSGKGPYFVTAFLFDGRQQVVGRYDKRELMPVGEYVLGQELFPILKEWFDINRTYNVGMDPEPITDQNGVRIGTMICYEDMNPVLARTTTKNGADFLVCLINGTAFENKLALRQHKNLALMRSVECRRHFLRCGSTGVTCVISPAGQIKDSLPPQTEGTLIHELSLPSTPIPSIYVQIGDLFAWLCFAVCISFTLVCYIRRQSTKESKPEQDPQSSL